VRAETNITRMNIWAADRQCQGNERKQVCSVKHQQMGKLGGYGNNWLAILDRDGSMFAKRRMGGGLFSQWERGQKEMRAGCQDGEKSGAPSHIQQHKGSEKGLRHYRATWKPYPIMVGKN